MKRFFTRISVTSVALVLLCVIVVAQTENATKSVTSHRLTVSPNPVELIEGESTIVDITPNPGYYHPKIYYQGCVYEVGQPFEGDIFIVTPIPNSSNSFIIQAKDIDKKANKDKIEVLEDNLYIDVEMIQEDLWDRNMVRSGGIDLIIRVTPKIQNKN